MCINYSTKNKKGYITVEAAIFLPVFILAMLSLISLIRMVGIEQNIMCIYSDEATKIAKEAYVTGVDNISTNSGIEIFNKTTHGVIFRARICDRIKKEENRGVYNPQLKDFKYLYKSGNTSGLISANFTYTTKIHLPIGFSRKPEFEEFLLFRAFIGADLEQAPMSYHEMETEEDSELVFVFPRAGERYHKHSCSVIQVCPKEVLLTSKIKKEFTPCRLCRPDQISNGSKVFCFDKAGKAYHRGNCPLVERYVVPMEKEEAIKNGYTPCKVCGG